VGVFASYLVECPIIYAYASAAVWFACEYEVSISRGVRLQDDTVRQVLINELFNFDEVKWGVRPGP
jgi:hypothetical protein